MHILILILWHSHILVLYTLRSAYLCLDLWGQLVDYLVCGPQKNFCTIIYSKFLTNQNQFLVLCYVPCWHRWRSKILQQTHSSHYTAELVTLESQGITNLSESQRWKCQKGSSGFGCLCLSFPYDRWYSSVHTFEASILRNNWKAWLRCLMRRSYLLVAG